MKKLFITLCLMLFFAKPAFAQTPTTTSTPSASVDYSLAYPGILPDSKLYMLKVARDHIEEFLITDPLKKTEFDILMSDKRLAAASELWQKGEISLAQTTLSKGENYFDEALINVQQAKTQGYVIKGQLQNMLLSSQKHEEVISQMQQSHPSGFLDQTKGRVQQYEKQVTQMLLKS